MKNANAQPVTEIEVTKGNDDDIAVEKRCVVLQKRTFVGPIAYVEKTAFLERSREYGNKAHVGVKITMPCYPNEVYETLEVIDDILNTELETALKVVREGASSLIDTSGEMPVRTRRSVKKAKKKKDDKDVKELAKIIDKKQKESDAS